MFEIRYPRYTLDTVDRGMLDSLTISEMECPMRLPPTNIRGQNLLIPVVRP